MLQARQNKPTNEPNHKPKGFRFGFGCQNRFCLVLNDGTEHKFHLHRRCYKIDVFAMPTVGKPETPAADSTRSVHQCGYTAILMKTKNYNLEKRNQKSF